VATLVPYLHRSSGSVGRRDHARERVDQAEPDAALFPEGSPDPSRLSCPWKFTTLSSTFLNH
jgi:hypothetical protein